MSRGGGSLRKAEQPGKAPGAGGSLGSSTAEGVGLAGRGRG